MTARSAFAALLAEGVAFEFQTRDYEENESTVRHNQQGRWYLCRVGEHTIPWQQDRCPAKAIERARAAYVFSKEVAP